MTYLNPPFRLAVGLDPVTPPAEVWRLSVDPADQDHWVRTFRSASAVGEPFNVDLEAATPDKRRRRYQLRGLPVGTGGRGRGYWGTAEDVTAGMIRNEAARAAEERYRILANIMDRPAIGLDLQLCVRSWNSVAAARTGIPETTAIGRTLAQLPAPFGGAVVEQGCRQALEHQAESIVEVSAFGGERRLRVHPFRSGLLVTEEPHAAGDAPSPAGPAEASELLHTVLRSTNDIIVVQDPEGTYIYFNAPASLGIAIENVVGKQPREIFPGELADRIVNRVHAVCTDGRAIVDQTTIDWRGSRRWFQEHISPVRDAEGTVTAVLSIARDITGQRTAEHRLRESEALYRSFVEHSVDGIWKLVPREPVRTDLPVEEQAARISRALIVEECNDSAARIHGYDRREDLIGTAFSDHLPKDSPARDHLFRSFVQGGYRAESVEVKAVDRNGHVRFLTHTLVGAVVDGTLTMVWGNIAEVTRQRLADREMRLLAQTITCAQDCVSITDLQDNLLFVNDAFLRTYGYSDQEELTGKNITMVRGGLQEPANGGPEIREKTLAGGWNGELINRRKDGSTFPVELWTSVVKGEDGGPVAMVGVARDITERRRAEEQIRASLHEKEVMLKEIHHRVKNNLQIVSSLLSLQSEYIVDPETLRFFRESQNRVKSMALVHEKLYQSTNLARVDFDGYLRELATHLVRSSVNDAGTVDVRLETNGVSLSIDKAIPCGIIVNELVTNALKYAFPAGRQGVLYVECAAEGPGEIRLVVGDDGVGLPAEFDVEQAETLGLTLVQMLVDQLQARLTVRRQASRLGARTGVEFEIRFTADNGHGTPDEKRHG
jgi:PAS domain S-box-containing protein